LANQANIQQVNNFVGGLNTEASPLNFPSNASLDEANFVLNTDGTRQRRLGLDHESFGGYHALDVSNSYTGQFKGFRWDSVGGDSTLSIQVVQMAACIIFFDNTQEYLGNPPWGCIELPVTGDKKFDFTVVNGNLMVATGETNCYVIEYHGKGTFTYEMVSLKIRDLFGMDDWIKVDERPSVGTKAHRYNLYNQGWSEYFPVSKQGSYANTINYFKLRTWNSDHERVLPSNADMFQYGIVPTKEPDKDEADEKFKPYSITSSNTGTTQSPRGHFIIDAFSRGLSRKWGYEDKENVNKTSLPISNSTVAPLAASAGTPVESIDKGGGVYADKFEILTSCTMDGPNNFICGSCEYVKENNKAVRYQLSQGKGQTISEESINGYTDSMSITPTPGYTQVIESDGSHSFVLAKPVPCAYGLSGYKVPLLYVWFQYKTRPGFPDTAPPGPDPDPDPPTPDPDPNPIPNPGDPNHIVQDKETGRPTTIAAMGNRVFYGGVHSNIIEPDKNSVRYTGMIFFSQVAKSISDLHKCYQEADPTSRRISDLIATDGGHINITECDTVLKLEPLGQSLLVIAENGVWEIKGGDLGFLATEYIINKISDIGCINRESIIKVDGTIMYWTESSIQHITRNTYGDLSSDNISEQQIRTLILKANKNKLVGFYDKIKKTARWLIDDHDTELVYDLNTKAYYKNTFGKQWIRGYVDVPEYHLDLEEQDIQVGSERVFVWDIPLVYGSQARGIISSGIKYITIDWDTKYLTFSMFKDTMFKDWGKFNYSSYLVTGFNTSGNMTSKKTSPYLSFFLTRTEDGLVVSGVLHSKLTDI